MHADKDMASSEGAVRRDGISKATLEQAGIRYSDTPEPGSVEIPYHDLHGSRTDFCRYRLPHARANGQRYAQAAGSGTRAYIPPQFHTLPPGGDLVIVEGEFKALSLIDADIKAIGLPSFSTYTRGKDGEPCPLSGVMEAIGYTKPDRILFLGDADTATNLEFARNAGFLAKAVGSIPVVLPRIPMNGPGKGIDDCRHVLGADFPEFWARSVTEAEPVAVGDDHEALALRLLKREHGALHGLAEEARDKQVERITKMGSKCRSPLHEHRFVERAAELGSVPISVIEAELKRMRDEQRDRLQAESVADHRSAKKRSVVILPGNGVTITDCARELYKLAAPTHTLFMRGTQVVRMLMADGGWVLHPVRPDEARSLFENYASFQAWRVGRAPSPEVLKPTVMPEETARAILSCYDAQGVLPRINGLVNCPVLRERGGLLAVCGKGFDEASGTLVLSGGAVPDVPLQEAVGALEELIKHFDFQSGGDRSRALAALITPGIKMAGLIRDRLPVDIREADRSQAGKGYAQECVCAIYNDVPRLVTQKRGGVGSVDESFMEQLVKGRPFISFDNFRGRLTSEVLESFVTAPGPFGCRIAKLREIEVDRSAFTVMLTSNGVESTGDLANRASIIRIRKREGVTFPDTLGEIRARQPYYLGCVFAVIREWYNKGMPSTDDARHDFREWSQSLDWVVQNIFGAAPLLDGHREAQLRVCDPAMTFLRKVAIEVERQGQLNQPMSATRLCEIVRGTGGEGIPLPGMSSGEASNEERAARRIGSLLAPLFKSTTKIFIDGYTVESGEQKVPRADGNGYTPTKTYAFHSNHINHSNTDTPLKNGTVFQSLYPLAVVDVVDVIAPASPMAPASGNQPELIPEGPSDHWPD